MDGEERAELRLAEAEHLACKYDYFTVETERREALHAAETGEFDPEWLALVRDAGRMTRQEFDRLIVGADQGYHPARVEFAAYAWRRDTDYWPRLTDLTVFMIDGLGVGDVAVEWIEAALNNPSHKDAGLYIAPRHWVEYVLDREQPRIPGIDLDDDENLGCIVSGDIAYVSAGVQRSHKLWKRYELWRFREFTEAA